MKLIHMSDFHCSRSWMFNSDLLEKAIELVNGSDADIVVHTGDLTDWGLEKEFLKAKEYLERIEKPCFFTVGNHDARHEGFKTFARIFGRPDSRTIEQEIDGIFLAGLDSSSPDIDEGHIGREQLSFLKRRIAEDAEGLTTVVFLHHHLVPVPNTGRERNVLVDAGEVLRVFLEKRVRLVLTGHKHMPWVWNLNGMLISTAGTASCERTTIPNSFNIVEIKDNRIRIEKQTIVTGEKRTLFEE